jgi:serine/threonine protein kinase
MTDPAREFEMLLFDAALQIQDAANRQHFLEQTCSSQPDRLQRLTALLEAHSHSADYFAGVTAACAAEAKTLTEQFPEQETSAKTNDLIGDFRLLERIGEGGCGVVYLAEQLKPVQRHVALKVIRPGMDTERVIARFEVERQSLAMMDHPHIAHVLAAGTTPTGRPYFAMEWVRGQKITDFCDEHCLSIRQRLELIIEVCQGIQHAHQKGVIHRDIKPSNVLVAIQDGKPRPKIIDFGIAKATGKADLAADITDAGGMPMGTLASMSPEQAASGGIDVDTRGDVYSIGILLYELLCGQPAFDSAELASAGYTAALEILLHRVADSPSVVVAHLARGAAEPKAAARRIEPSKWQALLRGDLDQVVMKCLEKDRSRRYETVNGLVLDLARFLANEPVLARPPSRRDRLQKFVARNRAACISAASITFTVLLGFAVSTTMYLRENAALREQQRLRRVAESAQAAEANLRQQAQARANVSRAALLLSQGQTKHAAKVLRETPLSTIEPSQEATGVFRSLGDWHLVHHRWQDAAECYFWLPLANRYITSERIPDTGDMIRTSPTLLCAGMEEAYETHRTVLVDRFTGTNNTNTAEQLVKMCLLRPATPELIAKLSSTVEFLRKQKNHQTPWISMLVNTSLALYELRANHPAHAIQHADAALTFAGQATNAHRGDYCTFLRSIIVQACRQTGNLERANAELAHIQSYLDKHEETFDEISEPADRFFVPVIERALAIILARETIKSP